MSLPYSAPAVSRRPVDPFGRVRRILLQVHLWIGLSLCIPMMALGLTGSILVFHNELAGLLHPQPRLTCAIGKPHTVAETIAAVQARIGNRFTPFLYEPPSAPKQAATVRLIALEGAAARSRIVSVLVDPVSLEFIRWDYSAFPGLLGVVLRLHGNLLMGRAGRAYVGWIGVAMLALGFSGLILWWPRGNRWRAAFVVKRGARGLRLHRDLHGVLGIWAYFVFITVSFSGIYFSFPQTISDGIRTLLPSREASRPAPISSGGAALRVDADRAVAIALAAAPRSRLLSIALPLRARQPYRISLAHQSDGRGAPEIVAWINPWTGELIDLTDPRHFAPAQTVIAWQRMLHFGEGLGWVWRILVFLSGLLPVIFAVTGIAMWLIKQSARRRVARLRVRRSCDGPSRESRAPNLVAGGSEARQSGSPIGD